MSIVIIHGPQGCGKTRYATELLKHYGCKRLVDDWRPNQRLRDGDMALTCEPPPFMGMGIRIVAADVAKRAIGVEA
jgi:serine kinase of HPr protein (carbohydrate metabolism regulator)